MNGTVPPWLDASSPWLRIPSRWYFELPSSFYAEASRAEASTLRPKVPNPAVNPRLTTPGPEPTPETLESP